MQDSILREEPLDDPTAFEHAMHDAVALAADSQAIDRRLGDRLHAAIDKMMRTWRETDKFVQTVKRCKVFQVGMAVMFRDCPAIVVGVSRAQITLEGWKRLPDGQVHAWTQRTAGKRVHIVRTEADFKTWRAMMRNCGHEEWPRFSPFRPWTEVV